MLAVIVLAAAAAAGLWWLLAGPGTNANSAYDAAQAQTVNCDGLSKKLTSGAMLSRSDVDAFRSQCGKKPK